FALVFERERTPLRLAAAGAAAGLAVATDLPLAVPALLLGFYAAGIGPRRLLAFGAGGAVGLLPLVGFDWWAFGSPFHLSYANGGTTINAPGIEQTPGGEGFYQLTL